MAGKRKRTEDWAEAKKRCRINAETVRMAKELGLTPRALIKNIPNKDQLWKAPVHVWIHDMYADKFGFEALEKLNKLTRDKRRRSEAERLKKSGKSSSEPGEFDGLSSSQATYGWPAVEDYSSGLNELECYAMNENNGKFEELMLPGGQIPSEEFFGDVLAKEDCEEAIDYDQEFGDVFGRKPDSKDIESQNRYLLKRQKEFRLAACYVAREIAELETVRKISLFGSVAGKLKKEIPRFREYRRANIKMWHECKDIDLAVWVDGMDGLRQMQKARSAALNLLLEKTGIGVAHHQLDIFIMDQATGNYLGRLCGFSNCPKGKPECLVPECGKHKHLKQVDGFTLKEEALADDAVVVLYETRECDDDGVLNGIPF